MYKNDDMSEDQFHIYSLLKKKDKVVSNKDSEFSMKYPPGFTPNEGSDGASMHVKEGRGGNSENMNEGNVDVDNVVPSGNHSGMNSKEGETESVCSGHFKKSEVPHTSGSIMSLLDDVVKVGQVMGYKMDGCMSNMAEIIESQGVDEIGRWKWEVVVMGDFNEVRNRSDRFGSAFNVQGANVFNSFISSVGLVEVSLGGCSFPWCHKSATKMSKLDRFLVFESLLNTYPNISAITLERYLSDHRPILLRAYHFDYCLTPFRFFHYWFEMEGFSKIVEGAWKESPSDESNAMIRMMGKLKFLKTKIREWNKTNMLCRKNAKVKWAIEGDENSSFFHGMLNKKRNSLSIPGIVVDDEVPKRLSLEQQVELESEVSNEEIKRAVWDCGTDKAPGADRFTFGFYRYFWYLIDNDVYNVVKYFFMHGEIPKGCNSSFIALIPKIPDANLILEGPFILDELIQWCKRKKKQFLVFKVDFEKAYDSVRWDFLDDILKKFGFGEKWCKWIQNCLRSSRGLVILNGSPTQEFQFYKGLKQGDPLSPFLFILIMESLHLAFQRVEDAGLFKGIKLGSSVSISHIFYADDAVFVGQWCESNINTLVHVLECFYRASGLRINLSKSKLMGLHVDSDKVNGAAIKLGCFTFKTPFTYLGSTVGGFMSRIQAWEEVVERVKSRLSKWKMKILSIGGVLRKLESIRSHFFNGHDPNCNKALWVNWKMVLAHKDKGGLGVSGLFALNRGLMFKWIWRFYTQDTSLWVRVIKAIYGEAGNMDAKVKAGSTSCWMSIVHEAKSLVSKGIDFFKFMRFKLGNGENARFWEDRWIEGDTLKKHFSRVYALELCKEITVAMKVKSDSLPTGFNVSRRGIPIDSIKCGICDTGAETSSHLFFSCCMVRQTVHLISRWWDISYAEFESYEDWLACTRMMMGEGSEPVDNVRHPSGIVPTLQGCLELWIVSDYVYVMG
nr:RNA-directed DNA polymerase, eukaryota [Tanacetum cinerariifolium]